MPDFPDHFSAAAKSYARYRPAYPAELIAALVDAAPATGRAWDCATGSGQVAGGLADSFDQVVASDASAAQLGHALRHPHIDYLCCLAETPALTGSSVDLVTVGQALHWFDFAAFFAEVRRVARPRAVVAAWCYGLLCVAPPIDRLLHDFYHRTLKGYWPPQRRYIEEGYRTIPFPFAPLPLSGFRVECDWRLAELCGYLRTWSAVQRYRQHKGGDPVDDLEKKLERFWGERRRKIVWPLHVLAGRVEAG